MIWLKLLVICVAAKFSSSFSSDLDHVWQAYRDHYVKAGPDSAEGSERLKKFQENAKMIVNHNIEADLGQHLHWLGLNHFSGMTDEEIDPIQNGIVWDNEEASKNSTQATYNQTFAELPAEFDNRKMGLVSSVRTQRNCSSCYAMSSVQALEGQWAKYTRKLVNLSVQNAIDCSKENGCKGGLPQVVYKYIVQAGGIDTEESYPYRDKDEKCRFNASAIGATSKSYFFLPPENERVLQEAVYLVGPISVLVNQTLLNQYSHGVLNPSSCTDKVNHAVLAVGYGKERGSNTPYWLLKNSYGKNWGDNGYVKLIRGQKKGVCGITRQPTFPVV